MAITTGHINTFPGGGQDGAGWHSYVALDWNSLPDAIKRANSLQSFKNKLANIVLEGEDIEDQNSNQSHYFGMPNKPSWRHISAK